MRAPARIFTPPVDEQLGDGLRVLARTGELNRAGTGAVASIEVWKLDEIQKRDDIRHSDRFDVGLVERREDFIKTALTREPTIHEEVLRQKLIELGTRLLTALTGWDANAPALAPPPPELVKSRLPDAPVADNAVVPARWMLDAAGVGRIQADVDANRQVTTRIAPLLPAPVVIVSRLRDVNDNTESLVLAWRRDGRWWQHTTPRNIAANGRHLVDIAAYGLPVTSNTARDVVDYLADYESANQESLVPGQVSARMGYQGDNGSKGFMWGRTLISTGPPSGQDIVFRGANDGDEQLADGFYQSGSLQGWVDAAQTAAKYPKVALALYASLTAPFLPILGCANFAVDLAHRTSTGKTTALRLAASCWGRPDEDQPDTAIWGWDMSRVWIERAAGTLNGIPLILNDTKRAKRPQDVAQVIYDFTAGRGRGRGAPTGMRRTETWRTVLLSSGEQPITSFSEEGGTRARVLTSWGMPFGAANPAMADVVRKLNAEIALHFGHAGPATVKFALEHRDDWPIWRDEYRKSIPAYVQKAGPSPVADRLAAYAAAIDLAAEIAHAALDLPWQHHDLVDTIWAELTADAGDADRSRAALNYLLSWAHGHQTTFWGRHKVDKTDVSPQEPFGGWAGRWDSEDDWAFIGFLQHRLEVVLKEAGFETETMVRLWRENGWLHLDSDGKRNHRCRINNEPVRVIAIRREAVEL